MVDADSKLPLSLNGLVLYVKHGRNAEDDIYTSANV